MVTSRCCAKSLSYIRAEPDQGIPTQNARTLVASCPLGCAPREFPSEVLLDMESVTDELPEFAVAFDIWKGRSNLIN
jgi:hypothetical protein